MSNIRKIRALIFATLLLALGYLLARLLIAPGSAPEALEMLGKIHAQREINSDLLRRNAHLEAEILELKSGMETVEERARTQLMMIRAGETLYVIPDTL